MAKTKRKPRSKGPRSQAFEGMERVRDATLDGICENIAEIREQKNQLVQDDDAAKQAALDRMSKPGAPKTYTHAGVSLLYDPGHASVRVRTVKETPAE